MFFVASDLSLRVLYGYLSFGVNNLKEGKMSLSFTSSVPEETEKVKSPQLSFTCDHICFIR